MQIYAYPTLDALATAAAHRFLEHVDEALAAGRHVHVALTGGGAGLAVLAAIGRSTEAASVDWNAVHVWWGDERFLPDGDPERNETGARAAFLDLIRIPATNVHAVPALAAGEAADGPALDRAASHYTAEIERLVPLQAGVPHFDLVLLGMGPDAHIASLFPEHAVLAVSDVAAAPVRNSPKPPPERVTLTAPVIAGADSIWLLVAGAEKREAAQRALAGAESLSAGALEPTAPASLVARLPQTVWLVDEAADPR